MKAEASRFLGGLVPRPGGRVRRGRAANSLSPDSLPVRKRCGLPGQALASLALSAWAGSVAAQAPTVPSGFQATLVAGMATSGAASTARLVSPTAMQFAPDGRLFVCQQAGALRVIKDGALLAAPFMTLTVNASGERGLLGIAFDPSFATNHFLYVYYSVPTAPLHNRVSRFTADGDVVVAGSELVILELDSLSTATNHNGGAIHFGPDGKLYVAVGDNATSTNAQSMTTRLGKILRINADGTIPADNPFFATASGANRAIWALGLRNPFTFQFEPGSSRVFINDVGEVTWEEINNGAAGANYGWPTTEGEFNPTTFPSFANPLFAYAHTGNPQACAITGGAFYPAGTTNFPAQYGGLYFYADYCAGFIRTYDRVGDLSAAFATGLSSAVDLKVGPDGALHLLQRGSSSNTGTVYRIDYPSNLGPAITQDPQDALVTVGADAVFSVVATGALPLTYQWFRDGVAIAGATSATCTVPAAQLSDSGSTFAVHVRNSFGDADSLSATLTVTTNTPPAATILTPTVGTLYSGGETINYSGSGTDAEDGPEPGSRFTWEVVFHHDTHTHPFIQPTTGSTSGSFVIPNTGEVSANVFYRVHLTVVDSEGFPATVTRDVTPRKSNLTITTSPAALQITLDGQPQTAPVTVQGVVGVQRTIGAPSPQTMGQTSYGFSSWSDGGAPTHTITTPTVNTTYTATFSTAQPALTIVGGATTVSAGATVQVQVSNGPGFPKDWVGLHATSAADTSYVDWKYLNGTRTAPTAGVTSAVVAFVAPTTAGTYNFRLFQNNTFTKLATSATLTVTGTSSPSLTLNMSSASPGQMVQVTLANGPGNPKDWIGLNAVAAADTAWTDWKYLNGTRTAPAFGMTSAVVTFAAPAAGTYNFRLFQNNTFTRLATSVTLTVTGTSSPTLTLNMSSASPGQMVQVALTNGPGNAKDWIGLNALAAADTAWTDWKYLNGTRAAPASGVTSAAVTFTAPAAGTYNFRLFQDNTFTRLATSATLTVTGLSSPTLSVSTASASPGQVVQVMLSAGPGNARDWIGLYLTTAPDSGWLDWKYMNGSRTPPVTGATSGTVPFTMPQASGTYEFRLFQNNTFTKLATSPTVTVP